MTRPGIGLQALVNSLETGLLRAVLYGVLFLAFVGGVVGLGVRGRFRGLATAEALEHADLARNLAEGRGYTTRCLRPADIWFLQAHGRRMPDAGAWPDLRHAPGYPVALAAALRVARAPAAAPPEAAERAEARAILPLGIACLLGTALLVYLLGRRVGGTYVGLMAVFVYVVTDRVLLTALSGSPVGLGAFLAAASAYAGVAGLDARQRGRPAWLWLPAVAVSAALAGAAALTLYMLVALLPLVLVLACAGLDRGRIAVAVLVVAVAAAVVAPWVLRMQRVTGAPLGAAPYAALNDSALHAGDGFDRSLEPDVRNAWVARALRLKAVTGLAALWERDAAGAVGSLAVVALFLMAFMHRFASPLPAALRWGTGAALLALLTLAALRGGEAAGRLHALYPLVVVVACAGFFAALDRIDFLDPAWHPVLMWLTVALVGAPLAVRTALGRGESPYPPVFPAFAAYAAQQAGGGTLATDIPWATAWYGACPSVLLPASVGEFQKLDAALGGVGALYLTQATSGRSYVGALADGAFRSWLPVLNGRRPVEAGFRFAHAAFLPPDGREQVVLVPEGRWAAPQPDEPAQPPATE